MSWEIVELKDIAAKSRYPIGDGDHGAIKPSDYLDKGIPYIRVADMDWSGQIIEDKMIYISEKVNNLNPKSHLFPGDIIISKTGATIGKVAIIPNKFKIANTTSSIGKITIDKKKANERFVFWAMKTPDFQKEMWKVSHKSAQPGFNVDDLKKFKIPLPPLSTQQNIAEILDTADALKRKDQELLQKYDELAQAIFIDMFGDPVKNEKGWEVKKLKDISTKIHSGNTPKGGSNVYVKEGITFFRSQNVWKNVLIYDDIAFIDEKTHLSMLKSSLKHKDILMTKTGRINTENSSLGRAALFLGEDDSANINGHVYLIRLKKNQVHEFVVHILTTKEYRGLIREVCVGGIDKRQLNKDHIEEFPIIYPPIENQKKYSEILNIIQKQRINTQFSSLKSESIFNTLFQKAFKGELVS